MDVWLAADCVVRRTLQRVERLGVATRVAENLCPAAATLRSFTETRAAVQRVDGVTERCVGGSAEGLADARAVRAQAGGEARFAADGEVRIVGDGNELLERD